MILFSSVTLFSKKKISFFLKSFNLLNKAISLQLNITNSLSNASLSHFLFSRPAMFPFSASCSSLSSVAVIQNQTENEDKKGVAEKGHDSVWSKSSSLFLHLPRLKLAAGIHKLVKGIRNLSNLFSIYKDDDDDDDDEMEMEIGCPTDVQHVAHIGWDGVNNVSVNGMKRLEERASGPFPLSSISLKQFELAMASQAQRSAAPFG